MQTMFRYNWKVREDWYKWCEDVPLEELLQNRTGGVGGILQTMFHIIDVEWSWIRLLEGKPDFQEDFQKYKSLEKVRKLDEIFKQEVEAFVFSWNNDMENRIVQELHPNGSIETFSWGEVMRHVIAHEIHHIGQISVWAREIGKIPVTANLIGRDLSKIITT
ncbi:DinB family protein [Peribacillus acanthi]|uniref:DinB family protein n=1 Tax=Peribacillus acanthi TaxID=2171554 RepID=UPI000D3E9497|nr:DinB family protein [Peribacillus acanthi]